MNILSLNPGSSSLKFALHSVADSIGDRCLVRGSLERLGTDEATLTTESAAGGPRTESVGSARLSHAVHHAIKTCTASCAVDAVGCRVVHGGPEFDRPARIDDTVLATVKALAPLAPLHNARDVETIEEARRLLPQEPIVAVFDTAFHRTLPLTARTYALPRDLIEKHELQRYGFHGISYRYVSETIASRPGASARKLVICHLGNGASACAVLDGVSIDTSMGMTPLEGLVMGTRCGDVNPGLILYLEREEHFNMRDVDRLLNSHSGLAGLSGMGADVRAIEEAATEGDPSAELALEVFAYRVAKYIGAYAAALGGMDSLAFCGGIGENSANMRRRICRRLGFLGITLGKANALPRPADGEMRIDAGGPVAVWIVRTDEERQIARETHSALI